MLTMPRKKAAKVDTDTFEQKLWKSADKLRKNIDAAEYKHIVLGYMVNRRNRTAPPLGVFLSVGLFAPVTMWLRESIC